MSADSAEEVKKHLKLYIGVFVALLIGTLVTVWAWTWHFESFAVTVAVALLIASVKAFLVLGYFMHLTSEKKTIYAILGATGFFVAGLMALFIWSRGALPTGTQWWEGSHSSTAIETKVEPPAVNH